MLKTPKIIKRRKERKANQTINFIDNRQISSDKLLSSELKQNLIIIKELLLDSTDVVVREFSFGPNKEQSAAIVWIDGLTNKDILSQHVLKDLIIEAYDERILDDSKGKISDCICRAFISSAQVSKSKVLSNLINAILSGDTGVIIDGDDTAIIVETKGWETRSVDEPDTEAVVRGSREGFVETLRVNTSLLRRRIKSPFLKIESFKIGRETQTDIAVCYLQGIANDKLVEEVRKRLQRIDTDSILESGYVEQYIEDNPYSIFPTIGNTEKPDVLAAKILEGRIGILTDGSPFALTAPFLFIENFESAEDYYSKPYYASLIRLLRYIAAFITLFAGAIYVAVTSYHQETIPSKLLLTMSAAREGVPFPSYAEALLMFFVYEGLREAGVRMPRPVGQAVSIVGALVIGEATVRAGLAGADMVIITAITAIFGFLVAKLADAITILRFSLIILSAVAGYFGIIMGSLAIMLHLSSLRSLGIPYLSPIAPFNPGMMKDAFIRAPLWILITRPKTLRAQNIKRKQANLKPQPDKSNNK